MENNSLLVTSVGPLKGNLFGETFFYNLNRNNFDKISAAALFESKFGSRLFKPNSLYVIVGTDSGLLPKFVQQKGLAKGSRYIFIEPASVLSQLQGFGLLAGLDAAIACISSDDWVEQSRAFKSPDYFYINAVQSFNAICAENDFIHEYAELSWYVAENLSRENWNNNLSLGNETFIANQIANLADNKLPAKLLKSAFVGKTVVLLAGGPSLDEVFPWLKLHRHQVVVFAVSRICRQLVQQGIEPDFIFSVDPSELSFDVSKELLCFSHKPFFIYSYHTVPLLVHQWHGLSFYLGHRLPWKSELNVANLNSTGPTVTNTALSVAREFGFKRIILAGVDLCFTRDGFTHAKGSNEHLAGPRFNLTSLQVETNSGDMAPTSCDFATAIDVLRLQAKYITDNGSQIINPSGHSAKISGIDYIPLSDIVLDEAAVDVCALVNDKMVNIEAGNDVKAVLAELHRVRFKIAKVHDFSQTALTVNANMYSAEGVIANYKDKKKLDKIEKTLKRDYRHFSRLVKKFGIRSFIKVAKPFDDGDWTAEEAKQLGHIYYEAYRDGANKLLALLDNAIARTNARQAELTSAPNFDDLFTQWRKDRSFTRAKIWRQKFPAIGLSESRQAEFEQFENLSINVLENAATRHFAKVKCHTNLALIKQQAAVLFKHHKVESLKNLLLGLDQYRQQEETIGYRSLINGYLAELDHDDTAAIAAYSQLFEGPSTLLEDALLRIANISIEHNNIDNSCMSLQCLSQINPAYLPFYAEVQRLSGELLPAIDSYNAYIAQFPEDLLVQIKLATLFLDNGIYDAASMMLDYTLSKQPALEAAIALKNRLPKVTSAKFA
ncbi:MAG: 6-hydroxymethylpterin diphosphokinase MptE-like protein [Methylococcaceae bacterium]|jgi:hypothetical protein